MCYYTEDIEHTCAMFSAFSENWKLKLCISNKNLWVQWGVTSGLQFLLVQGLMTKEGKLADGRFRMNKLMWLFTQGAFKVWSSLLEDILDDKCYTSPKRSWEQSWKRKRIESSWNPHLGKEESMAVLFVYFSLSDSSGPLPEVRGSMYLCLSQCSNFYLLNLSSLVFMYERFFFCFAINKK